MTTAEEIEIVTSFHPYPELVNYFGRIKEDVSAKLRTDRPDAALSVFFVHLIERGELRIDEDGRVFIRFPYSDVLDVHFHPDVVVEAKNETRPSTRLAPHLLTEKVIEAAAEMAQATEYQQTANELYELLGKTRQLNSLQLLS